MERIAIEPNSHLGMPPLQAVDLVAKLGCQHISIWLNSPGPINPYNYPQSSLRDDASLRQDMITMMRDKGISASLIDGFLVLRPGVDVESLSGDLEIAKELGDPILNIVSFEPDRDRTFDQLSKLVDMADAIGLEVVVEFAPVTALPDLASAVAAVQYVGRPSCRLLIDMMHLVRSGSGAADLAALDPKMIGYAHFCDATIVPAMENYLLEASSERLLPGLGEFPLSEILSALPRDIVIGLEIPSVSKAEAGISPYDHMVPAVETTRRMLAELDG